VVFDLSRPWRLDPDSFRSKSKNSPFEGHPVQGLALMTVVGGRCLHELAIEAAR
jgi:dihydroorotase